MELVWTLTMKVALSMRRFFFGKGTVWWKISQPPQGRGNDFELYQGWEVKGLSSFRSDMEAIFYFRSNLILAKMKHGSKKVKYFPTRYRIAAIFRASYEFHSKSRIIFNPSRPSKQGASLKVQTLIMTRENSLFAWR